MKIKYLLPAGLMLLVLASCSSFEEAEETYADPELQAIEAKEKEPLPFRVAVTPVLGPNDVLDKSDLQGTGEEEDDETGHIHWPLQPRYAYASTSGSGLLLKPAGDEFDSLSLPESGLVCPRCSEPADPEDASCSRCLLAFRPVRQQGAVEVAPGAAEIEFDRTALQGAIQEELQKLGIFSDVSTITHEEISDKLISLMDVAQSQGDTMVLVPRVRRHRVEYKETSWAIWPSWALAILAWIPSWFIADETYQAEVELQYELYSARAGLAQPVKTFNSRGEFASEFDDLDRGWKFAGEFFVPFTPGYLSDANYDRVSERLSDHAEVSARRTILKRIHGWFEGFDIEDFRIRFPSRSLASFAVVAGANFYPNLSTQARPLKHAVDDVEGMAGVMTDVLGVDPNIPGRLETLRDREVTREEILESLRYIRDTATKADRVFFYFAGYGAAEEGPDGQQELYLVTTDADPSNLAGTAVSLREMGEIFQGCAARTIMVFLDTSFFQDENDGGSSPRTLPSVPVELRPTRGLEEYFAPMMSTNVRFVMTGAEIGGVAQEDKNAGHGLMTSYMLRGLTEKKADSDRYGEEDDKVSANEIFKYTQSEVETLSSFGAVDVVQVPQRLGSPNYVFYFTDPDKAIETPREEEAEDEGEGEGEEGR